MVRIAIVACFLLLACQPKPPAESPEDAAIDKQVRADVTALIETWAKASTDGDWATVGKLYADDEAFAWIERGQVRYASREAALTGLQGVTAAGSKIKTDVSDISITPLSHEAASFRMRVQFSAEFGTEAPPVHIDAILTGVAFEYEDGWKLLQGHMGSRPDVTPPPPAQPPPP